MVAKMKPRIWLAIIIAAILLAFAFGYKIRYAEQGPIFQSLRTIAAIIFGVLGAWVGIVYPKGLSYVFHSGSGDEEQAKQVQKLLIPLRYATVIVACTLVLEIIVPIAKKSDFLVSHASWCRGISFCILIVMVFIQLVSLLLTFAKMDQTEEEMNRKLLLGKMHNQLTARTQHHIEEEQ